jgi:hypothetical protein
MDRISFSAQARDWASSLRRFLSVGPDCSYISLRLLSTDNANGIASPERPVEVESCRVDAADCMVIDGGREMVTLVEGVAVTVREIGV